MDHNLQLIDKVIPVNESDAISVTITLKRGKKVIKKISQQSESLTFGSSSFCDLEVPLKISNLICGLIQISSSLVKIFVNTEQIPIYVDQDRLMFNKSIVVADLAAIQVGRYEIVIEVFKSKKSQSKDAIIDPLQISCLLYTSPSPRDS